MKTNKRPQETSSDKVKSLESQNSKIAVINKYLSQVSTFSIITKELIKEGINKIIDERFAYIEKNLREANEAIHEIENNF